MLHVDKSTSDFQDKLLSNINNNLGKYTSISSFPILFLNYIARCADKNNKNMPAFPEAIDMLKKLQNADGSVSNHAAILRSIPFLMAILLANTLLKWNKTYQNFSEMIKLSLNHLLELAKAGQVIPVNYPLSTFDAVYGRYFNAAMTMHEILYDKEIGLLLANPAINDYMDDEQINMLQQLKQQFGNKSDVLISTIVASGNVFKKYFISFLYAYHMPSDVFYTKECEEYADRVFRESTFYSVAFAAKFYDVTGDDRAYYWMKNMLSNQPVNVLPQLYVTESIFSFWYLLRADINIPHYFPTHIYRTLTQELPDKGGYAFHAGVLEPDSETSSLACTFANRFNIKLKMSATLYDEWWHEPYKYFTVPYRLVKNISGNMTILSGCLSHPQISYEQKKQKWEDVLDSFADYSWVCSHHFSPLYSWENIIYVITTNYHKFPSTKTQIHCIALDQILKLQYPSGGFGSAAVGNENVLETAFALLGIKNAIKYHHLFNKIAVENLKKIAERAEAFIVKNWLPFSPENFAKGIWQPYLELWNLDSSANFINIDESIITSSLLLRYE